MSKRSFGPNPWIYPEPVLLVGSYDAAGKANLMTAAWGGICCSEPLCLQVSVRPPRYTHEAISARKAFTVGIPSEKMVREADYLGIASGRRYDKFAAAGLTAVRSDLVDAPYAAQCPVVLECRLRQSLELGVHTMFIGEILDVKVDESCLGPDGKPDPALIKPLIYDAGTSQYYGFGPVIGKGFSVGKVLLPGHEDE